MKQHIERKMTPATSYNRAYLASATAYAKIPLWGTSDTLGPLGERCYWRLNENV